VTADIFEAASYSRCGSAPRPAYRRDVREFIAFSGLISFEELRSVTRAHVIAWRKDLDARNKKGSTVRRKLSSLSSLFDYLCDKNAVAGNPVDGVERPESNGNEGSTPALGDAQARRLLEAPPTKTLKRICVRSCQTLNLSSFSNSRTRCAMAAPSWRV
jgi:site-specific recombinase XerD